MRKTLDLFTPISLAVIRFSFLLRWLIDLEKLNTATTSLKKTEYRAETKADLDIFFGKFKITANMLGERLVVINAMFLGATIGTILRVYWNVLKVILR